MALLIQPRVRKELAGVPHEIWDRLKERLEAIARDPYGHHPGAKRLQGSQGGFAVRQGNWRVIYVITGRDDVEVIRVAHRREVYR
jgi:mRNA-degrading endonuclease RelE of RelBE toxin-antitoxin system